jgi:uncharacterized membrane protein HdeD (DUF308 family)
MMTADVSGTYSEAPPAKRGTGVRVAAGVFGVVAVLLGGFLLLNPYEAARTLALLIGLTLVVGGCFEIGVAWDAQRRALAVLPGVLLVIGGVVTAFWPGVTLWTLAVLTGLSLILAGVGRVALAVVSRAEVPAWRWFALAGAVNVIVGVMAIAWPEATVLVLSVLLGLQIIGFGLILLVAALTGPRTTA